MDDPFDSPRMLIDDAEERISGLEKIIEAFVSHEDRAYGSELDIKSGKYLLYVQYPTAIPAKISMEIRAVARDLRDALDHAVYASSVILFGGVPTKTKFLVANTEDGIQQEIDRNRCKDVHENIVALMVRENACKTGNRTVWCLNEFRNTNTHRVVALANARSGGFGIGMMRGGMTFDSMNEWRSTNRRLYYAKIRPHSPEFEIDITPTMEIRAHPQFGLGCGSAPIELRKVAAEVRRLVGEVEAETTRIKRRG